MAKKVYKSAEIVATTEGRQYHMGVGPGEVASSILLCGDPARAYKVAQYFEKASKPITNREYVTITGRYKGFPLTVVATGIGPDNTEIAVIELSQIVKSPTFIRIGSCSSLKKDISIGDVIISTGAVRLENTSTYFVCEGYPAVAHYEIVEALVKGARSKKIPFHVGITAAAPGFYGAQGRRVPGFEPLDEDMPRKLARMNVLNYEMETSCLFTLASISGARAGAVCAVYGNRYKNEFIDSDKKEMAERRCIETGLAAFENLV